MRAISIWSTILLFILLGMMPNLQAAAYSSCSPSVSHANEGSGPVWILQGLTANDITVEFEQKTTKDASDLIVSILTSNGQLVYTAILQTDIFDVSCLSLPPDNYVLNMQFGDEVKKINFVL